MRILVTDGDTRAALAVTRSLGRSGAEVFVSAPRSSSLAGSSRHCAGERVQPSREEGPQALIDGIARIAREIEPELVLGITDVTLTAIHSATERFAPCRIPPPSRALYERASDKVELFEASIASGTPVPEGIVVRDGANLPVTEIEKLGRPLVVRPALSWRAEGARWIQGSVSYEGSVRDLQERVHRDPALAHPFLVQRRITGEGCGFFVLAREGKLLRTFAHRRLREKPPAGGVSTLCVSVALPEDMADAARRWTAALGWSGLAMLEFKRDAQSGRAYLLEVNARPWGSMALAAAAGIDFPTALLQLDQLTPAEDGYEAGVRLRWWWGDVDHFFLSARSESASRGNAMLRAFGRALTAGPWPEAWDTFRRDDPVPFAIETLRWITA